MYNDLKLQHAKLAEVAENLAYGKQVSLENFPEALYVWRQGKGLTQGQVAELVGVTKSQVQKWEAGATFPRSSTWKKFREAGIIFNVTFTF